MKSDFTHPNYVLNDNCEEVMVEQTVRMFSAISEIVVGK